MTPHALLAPARLAGAPLLRTQSDERLVDLVRAGYEPAFEAIVTRYRKALQRYCAGILPDGRAEDAVQQTLVRAHDAINRDTAELNLRPWLYRIAHNTALNALRDGGAAHEQISEEIDGVERPDQAFERSERLRTVVDGVQALPARQRDAILLRELEGRSYDEIAAALGVSGGAVRQLLNRARTTLRAGASAVVPVGLITKIPWAAPSEAVASRIAELTGTAGAGAVTAKVIAGVLVTGAVAGGIAGVQPGAFDRGGDPQAREARAADARPSRALPELGDDGRGKRRRDRDGVEGHRRGRHGRDYGDRSGKGDGGGDDSSGRGSGSSSGSGSSGSGSGDSGPGSSGSGSGSGSSGSGSSGSGSSGSGTSSGSSGSGSGSGSSGSGSGSSGSGSSGSGSSGSGSWSGELQLDDH